MFLEHLVRFTIAVRSHGLCLFLRQGNLEPESDIFKDVADEWKKLFDCNIEVLVSDDVQKFAIERCES